MMFLSFDMGLRNLAYCQLNTTPAPRIVAWEVVDVVGERNAKRMTCQRAAELMLDFLRQRFPRRIDDCTVLVEQQPMRARCANLKMKVLSHVLQAHFYSLGFKVKFVSPRRKLKRKCHRDYQLNKRQAVSDCLLVLPRFDAKWTAFFTALPKKDDAADCLLQALAVAVT